MRVVQVLKIATAIDDEYQHRDGNESMRALKVLSVHLALIDCKCDAAKKILRVIQKMAKEKGVPEIEQNAKAAITALK